MNKEQALKIIMGYAKGHGAMPEWLSAVCVRVMREGTQQVTIHEWRRVEREVAGLEGPPHHALRVS